MQHERSALLLPERTRQYAAMVEGYRASGGLAASPELLALCRRHSVSDVAVLARWIVERSVVCFEWQSQTWFPMFQFRPPTFAPALQLQPLLTELAATCDAWQVARWLVMPHRQLGGRVPLSLLDTDASAVLRAARHAGPPMGDDPPPTRVCQPT